MKTRTQTGIFNTIHITQKVEIVYAHEEGRDKQHVILHNYILTVLKKNENLIYATTWEKLEVTMLREKRQIKKDTYLQIPLTGGIYKP